MKKCYRCGYCGQPTNEQGTVITLDRLKLIDFNWDNAEKAHGECCTHQQEYEAQRRIVTADMASDAGQTDLEGHLI